MKRRKQDSPVRQCMACRKHDSKPNLLRIVRRPSGVIEFDPEQSQDGRGAYVCAEARCLSGSREAGLIGRHLKRPDAAAVYLAAAEHLKKRRPVSAESLIGFAVRSGSCSFGVEAVEIEAARNKIRLLVLCPHAGSDTRHKMQSLAERGSVPLIFFNGKRTLGDSVGKPNCRILGVRDSGFAKAILAAASAPVPGKKPIQDPVRERDERSDER